MRVDFRIRSGPIPMWGEPSPARSPRRSAPWCLVSELTVRMVYRLLDDFSAERPDGEEECKTECARAWTHRT